LRPRWAGRRIPALAVAALLAAAGLAGFSGCDRPGNRSAAELYPKYCARCHGPDGRGVPRQTKSHPKADLTLTEARGGGARDFFYRRIAEGYGPMPAFSRKLSPQEIERLVDYTMALARGEVPPAAPKGKG
jgi:mono/diheme cytochrome c family protein